VEPDDGDRDAHKGEQEHGALHVDAEEVVLPGSECLAAQSVQGARHSKLPQMQINKFVNLQFKTNSMQD
jgi:hypothetical protein